jgi:phosphopantothenoylcysteine decarboxylase/phosphopantothenate--cysteine ligase
MHLVITAGGTREYIDPVRFISNASSGKMGYALVRAALKAGHKVTLITTPTALRKPVGAKIVEAETAAEMFEAVKKHFARCDCLIMAAAVADYTPAAPAKTKIKKSAGPLTLKLKPTADIVKWAGTHKKGSQIVVGFALEDKALRKHAEAKMKEKNLDMIIANTPAAIAAEESSVFLRRRAGGWGELTATRKSIIARRVIREIDGMFE